MSGEKRHLEIHTLGVGGESPMKTPRQRIGLKEVMPIETRLKTKPMRDGKLINDLQDLEAFRTNKRRYMV